ncbi:metallopeptidase TldD-related protein [Smaragdicoccus niigatensis]|uniref:metallopeptidase TldD-related protein n=1 Tax=Smaragdicoccus niigatensis TaxID=359359 RepID=UPI000372DEBE|nr:metallopeptidase TldD-related protein [Smaragdicoccus niigatensis]
MIPGHELVDRALAYSRSAEAMVIVHDSTDASLRWARNSMTTNGIAESREWTVIAVSAEGGVGSVTSTSVDPADIEAVVRAAEAAANAAPPATDRMPLPDADGEAWDSEPATTSIDIFSGITPGLAAGFAASDELYGFAHHQVVNTWLGSTTGLRRAHVQPTGSIEINGKRTGSSAWVGAGTADFRDVDVDDLLAQLTQRLDWCTRRVDLPAGRYDTILPPSAVADLMIYLYWTMEGRGAHEGHSAFAHDGKTRVSERLSTLPLTLFSDPTFTGLECEPFIATTNSSDMLSVFDNGLAVGRTNWIHDGVISNLIYPRATAAEFGATFTAPADNLILNVGSSASIDDLVANTERGLLLTTLWYIREVDPASLLLTGLTRDGVYLIENGQIAGEVNNFRFNESPIDLLRRATDVGTTERTLPREWKDWFTRTAMPPMRIPDFHMSSVSAAT